MSFAGLRVLSLESRRAKEMEALILRHGGIPVLAPSVKEQPFEDPSAALGFIDLLEAGQLEMVICMTGAGLTYLQQLLAPHMSSDRISGALRRSTIVSRGPKPAAVLRGLGVPVEVMIPEPNTWKEIIAAIAPRVERRIAVQEYGRPAADLHEALARLGASVTSVVLYRWELPDDLEPLRAAARLLTERAIDVALFTSSIQFDHLLDIARGMGVEGELKTALAADVVAASIGPVTTATLVARGITPDVIPKHPKMAALVKAASETSGSILAQKVQAVRREPR
jgi:uroporphyrinogen-III synthase